MGPYKAFPDTHATRYSINTFRHTCFVRALFRLCVPGKNTPAVPDSQNHSKPEALFIAQTQQISLHVLRRDVHSTTVPSWRWESRRGANQDLPSNTARAFIWHCTHNTAPAQRNSARVGFHRTTWRFDARIPRRPTLPLAHKGEVIGQKLAVLMRTSHVDRVARLTVDGFVARPWLQGSGPSERDMSNGRASLPQARSSSDKGKRETEEAKESCAAQDAGSARRRERETRVPRLSRA